eukprot:TRINITY_DN24412_c0_g1_i1.p1 TRINITY_DN24412_c0_g1~~TRINITY_DN24412_c0_g1_i1.p1  ORF type:complete len:131 (+),score=5.72 TRINITY_DN24412_c0_g1_i1:111-503(+)
MSTSFSEKQRFVDSPASNLGSQVVNNIVKVYNECDIDEILIQMLINSYIMISSNNCPACEDATKKNHTIIKTKLRLFFVYVNITRFESATDKYTKNIKIVTSFYFYVNSSSVAEIEGNNMEQVDATIKTI